MLDLDDEHTLASFISKEWIGKNRRVPKPEDIPDDLANYFAAVKEVPDDIKERYYPGKHETVNEFLKILLPRGTYTLPNILNSRTLPPQDIVSQLHANICQAVLDGRQSVTDPVYPNSRLPLWVVSFWKYMWEITGVQDLWRKAEKWLESKIEAANGKGKEMCLEAQRLLHILRWSEETEIAGANQDRTHVFAVYLSDRAETDDTIDTMVAIETLRFLMLEKRVVDEEIKHLIFPAYMEKQKHWIVVKVDFERKELSYGDSLAHQGMPEPIDILKNLQWWTKEHFGRRFKILGDELEHGEQNDWTDCGIVAANTAAREIFGDTKWTADRKQEERVCWFLILSQRSYPNIHPSSARAGSGIPTSLAALLNPIPVDQRARSINEQTPIPQ